MNTLILNGYSTTPFIIETYNRNTTFDLSTHMVNSTAYLNLKNEVNTISQLQNIGRNGITNITIKHDGETIYNLANLNASIGTLNETLVEDTIAINVSINFG